MIVLVLGSPSIGKGTQCQLMTSNDEMTFHKISAGDLIRGEKERDTPLGKFIKKNNLNTYNQLSKYVMTLIKKIILDRVGDDHLASDQTVFLLDAKPRSLKDAQSFDSMLNIDLVVSFEPENNDTEFLVERAKQRLIHLASGRTYGPESPPKVAGKDDVTGEDLVAREDDQEANVRERLELYKKTVQPMIETYYSQKPTFKKIVVNKDRSVSDIQKEFYEILSSAHDAWKQSERKPSLKVNNIVERYCNEIAQYEDLYQLASDRMASISQSKFSNRFPGMNVIPMNEDHVSQLTLSDYRIAAKMDGVRYLMLVLQNEQEVVLIDRAMNMFSATHFIGNEILKLMSGDGDSLLDGEILTIKQGDKTSVLFTAIDAFMVNGIQTSDMKSYEGRLDAVRFLPIFPTANNETLYDIEKLISADPSDVKSKSNLLFTTQKLWPVLDITKMKEYCDRLLEFGIHTDGVIFTNNVTKYIMGLSKLSYKWKPITKMTVDFKLQCADDRYDLLTWNSDTKAYEVYDQLADSDTDFKYLNNVVVECIYDNNATTSARVDKPTNGGWVFVCARPDKANPNPKWCVEEFVSQFDRYVKTLDDLIKMLSSNTNKSVYRPPAFGKRESNFSGTRSNHTFGNSKPASASEDEFTVYKKTPSYRGGRGRGVNKRK